ncbi:MAG: hypothetical protein Q9208_006679 [Pyrenodesmia sp. 3 TL-2023]
MAQSYAQHSDALQAFHRWRLSAEAQTPGLWGGNLDTTSFIPQSKLEAYLTSHHCVETLLDVVLDGKERPAVAADYIRRYYLRTFAILLCIDEAHWIYNFQQYRSLRDEKMPYDTRPADFPYTGNSNLFERFQAAQWQFCAMPFQYDMKDRFKRQEILPITSKREIGRGGSATIFQIVSSQQPNPNTFVLKTYKGDEAERNHKIEREAYINLRLAGRPSPNIVAFYGSFIQDSSYNLILEYADRGNLETFMKRTPKPESVEEVLFFLDRLVNIVHGVQCIHGRIGNTGSASQVLNGLFSWHQDIKPANILVFGGHRGSPYDCEFKIADLGLAHFKPYDSQSHDPSDLDAFGTRAYGAPETYRRHRDSQSVPLQVTTAVDIWSLGCVFSEAAVWVHHGWRRVKEYRRKRSLEIDRETKGDIKGEQIFHWDNRILGTVRDAHQDILGKTSTAHWVVRELVEQVVGDMLQHGPRPHAAFIFDKAKRIIKERADHFRFCLPRLSWSADAELAGFRELGISTMDPPQPPPDITPDSSIWSGERGRSTHPSTTAALPDPFVASDDPPISPTSSMPESSTQSVGNYGPEHLSRESTSLEAKTPVSAQPRPPTLVHDQSLTTTNSGDASGSAQQHPRQGQSGPPTLSVEEGHSWKELKKRSKHPILPGFENLASLNERDHIFLVDNSETMKQYKKHIADVVSLLAYIVKDSDDDGLDIHFTQSASKINSKKSTEISSAIYQQPYIGISDMRGRLGTILQEHINRFGAPVTPSRSRFGRHRSPHPQKRLSFYILTDAKWQPTDVGEIIKDMVQKMKDKGLPKEHVGIQFIRFGEDQASIDKLDELDHGLGLNAQGMDVVDHTYWNGNVWKMLLGAVNDWYDDDPS